ncbi:MAG: YeiH family protein [Armatimonadota bacterium]
MQIRAEYLPGWLIMLAIAVVSVLISGMVVVGGKNPVEPAVLAIILGILLANVGLIPEAGREGIRVFETPLILGIVLIGAGLDVATVVSQGVAMLTVVVGTMIIAFWSIYYLGKAFGLSQRLSLLLSVGTTICGGTAIAVTAPLIEAKEEETSYAIGTIALWGVVAMIVYPAIFRIVAPDAETVFGLFAGVAVQSTPQAVGAGFIFSELAGDIATAVKLVRNTFIAPVAFAVAIWYAWWIAKQRAGETVEEAAEETVDRVNWIKGFPWFLFGYFVMVAMRSYGFFTEVAIDSFTSAGKFLILLGMAGIGLNTRFDAFKGIGGKPLVVGVIGAVILAAATLALIRAFGIV